jgi:hypothetical protein
MSPKHLLAAAALCALMTVNANVEAQSPARLRPDQQKAVELTLQSVDPAMRPFMRERLWAGFAGYSEAQIATYMKGLTGTNAGGDNAVEDVSDDPAKEMSPADLAYNRKQFEPAIRKAHAAQVEFDRFANEKLQALCPKRDEMARWGSAWRYEMVPLKEGVSTATWNVENDIAVMGSSYAPQDGRYDFDFSKVRYSFDKAAVEGAIRQACMEYRAQGRTFLAKLDPLIAGKDWEGAHRLEQQAMGWVEPVRRRLDDVLTKQSPNSDFALVVAMQNPKRAK